MLWSKRTPRTPRRSVALAALLALGVAACGFTPVYGPGGGGSALANKVIVTAPNGSNAFVLAQALEDRLGPPTVMKYELTFTLETESDSLSITQTQETNRYNIIGTATYTLRDPGTEAIVQTGRADGFTSYSATGTTVATAAAEQDSYERLMVLLADKIIEQMVTLPLQSSRPAVAP